MLHAVIMAGGSGTRFWPMSRKDLPKQFLTFHGDRSLLQQAAGRINGLSGDERVWVITNRAYVDTARRQLPELPGDHVIGEPAGRDTAACIGLAAALLASEDPDAIMAVLAADHIIEPVARYHEAVKAAVAQVERNPAALVTFGIVPNRPATGYGYLRQGEPQAGAEAVFKVRSFHEKPNHENAVRMVDSGEYLWNSGMFCWRAATILNELRTHQPELHAGVMEIADAWSGPNGAAVFNERFPTLPKISIDYAVMEKSANVFLVRAPFEWDDVGSWLALERVFKPDHRGNVTLADHLGVDTGNCVIVGGGDGHLIATLGVEDLIVVHTPAITLVAKRSEEQRVKELLKELETRGRVELL